MEGSSVPEDLINALEEFIVKIEPEECNFIVLNNDSKMKLFKDWRSYTDRIEKNLDNISLWTKKDRKSSLSNIYINNCWWFKIIIPKNIIVFIEITYFFC